MNGRQQSVADRRRYEVLEQMLRERQAEVRNKLRSLREVLPEETRAAKDPEEQVMQDLVRDMDIALVEMESETLRKIDAALRRLEEGTYGICEECDEKISEPRLRALPFASLCRDCQQAREGEPTERPLHALEEGLSISARNDRTPPRFEKEQVRLWTYAEMATARAAGGLVESRTARVPVAARSSRRAPAVQARAKAPARRRA